MPAPQSNLYDLQLAIYIEHHEAISGDIDGHSNVHSKIALRPQGFACELK